MTSFAYADLEVTAQVDRNKMAVGDTFTYTVSVTSSEAVNISDPRLPDLGNFDLLNSWQGSEQRITFDGSRMIPISTALFSYTLAPKKEGNVAIGASSIEVEGKVYRTKSISIDVKKSYSAPNQNQTGRPGRSIPRGFGGGGGTDPFAELDDMFNQLMRRRAPPGFGDQDINTKEAFFIQAEVDKKSAFVGEQITASWYIYTRGQITEIDTLKYPNLKGFWKEDIELATRLNFTTEVINGLVYKKALLASYALFPIKAGQAKIDSYKAKCKVISGMGFGQTYEYTKSSKDLVIDVKPIPTEGRPAEFNGAVGQFEITGKVEQNQLFANEPFNFKVRLSGRGNAKLVDLQNIQLPPELELYDIKKEAKFYKDGQSFKEFNILIIPRKDGPLTIPSLIVGLFDPATETFYTKSTPESSIQVLPPKDFKGIEAKPLAESESEVKPEKMPQLKMALAGQNPFVLYHPMSGVFSALVVLMVLLWRWNHTMGWIRLRSKSDNQIKNRIQLVEKAIKLGDIRTVGRELTNLIYFALGSTSGEGGSNVELNKMLLKTPPSFRREYGEKLKSMLAQCELLAFAPDTLLQKYQDKDKLKALKSEVEIIVNKATKSLEENA